MRLKQFLKIKGVIFIILGIALVLLVPKFIHVLGFDLNDAGLMLARWNGACFIGIGIISLNLSKVKDRIILDDIIDGLFTCDALCFGITVLGQIQGNSNIAGWIAIAFWFIMMFGLGYFRFIKKKA